jgi:hypothetical protein
LFTKFPHFEAQRYGKGRAANESETKPPNLDKKRNFKTANGRRVPLTDLLCLIVKTKSQQDFKNQFYPRLEKTGK